MIKNGVPLASFGGPAFGAPIAVRGLGQPALPPQASPRAVEALEKVRSAERARRAIERSLGALEQAIGPEAALAAYEQAQESVEEATKNYEEVIR